MSISNHGIIDQRSLAFGRAIADRVANDPAAIDRARSTVARWLTTCSPGVCITLREWQDALDGPMEGVVHLLTSSDERATRLRQSNPFAGVLSNHERYAIINQYRLLPQP